MDWAEAEGEAVDESRGLVEVSGVGHLDAGDEYVVSWGRDEWEGSLYYWIRLIVEKGGIREGSK